MSKSQREDCPRIKLGYHFVKEEHLFEMGRALLERFDVELFVIPSAAALAWIEIALGVLAGGVGTVAMKKLVDLITEDLYKSSKDFVKGYMEHRKANRWNALAELRITFSLGDTRFVGATRSLREKDVLLALQNVKDLIKQAEDIISSRHLPRGTHLRRSHLVSSDDKDDARIWYSTRKLPERIDTICFLLDTKAKAWRVDSMILEGFDYYYSEEDPLEGLIGD